MKSKNEREMVTNHSKFYGRFNFKLPSLILFMGLMMFSISPVSAHCDSYDGPVIKEALHALEVNKVELVLKWIYPEQEKEIISLFNKTYSLKGGDKEIYAIVEKHFLETLVRLHRETEGEPYTGLKPAGSMEPIIGMADASIENGSADKVTSALTSHIESDLKLKYQKVLELSKVKDESVQKGRAYVIAYVEYTHTIEALHNILEHGVSHDAH